MKSLRWMLILAVFLAACAGGGAPQAPTETARPVETQVVTVVPATTEAATAAPEATTAAPPATDLPAAAAPVAYIGADGNLWVLDGEAQPRQVTADANLPSPDSGTAVMYSDPRWSSDGRLLAYSQDTGTPVPDGFNFTFALMVWDRESGTSTQVGQAVDPAGVDWKPGTHLLAYAVGVDPNYWLSRGQPIAEKAKGIQFFDFDTGETGELAPPAKGFHLVRPQWSPDGRFLAFDEVQYMEGRGNTDFYDFEAQEYISPGRPLGNYDWSTDGSQLVYDEMVYTALGTERISISDRNGENARQLSPEMEEGPYALMPVFSPDGSQVAYFVVPGGPDSMDYVVVVQPVSGGQPRELARFGPASSLAWFQDGQRLLLDASPVGGTGELKERQVLAVSVANGAVQVLANGNEARTP